MSFDPDRAVQRQREHLLQLAAQPGFAEYAADRARRMAREEHGLWKPLADIFPKEAPRARNRM